MNEAAPFSVSGSGPRQEDEVVRNIAARLMWWQPPSVSLTQPKRLIAQVMALGTWEDVRAAREVFGDEAFQAVLRDAPAGIFDLRSWTYWHHVFKLLPVPPLPKRSLLDASGQTGGVKR